MTFPPNFLWGVATAGYQVEGGIRNNDWSHFVNNLDIVNRVYGIGQFAGLRINLVDPGDALNHRDLAVFEADLDRAVALGSTVYRMSLEWSRLQPEFPGGDGISLDPEAVEFYADRIQAVLVRGLVLHLTLNHLTLPAWVLTPPVTSRRALLGVFGPDIAIEDRAFLEHPGWERDRTAELFARYAAAAVWEYHRRFSDIGQIYWATFNEPVGSMIGAGYFAGIWPPGFSLERDRGGRAYFNILRAHILAYDAIKEVTRDEAKVGIVHAMLHSQRTTINAVAPTASGGAIWGTGAGAVVGGIIGGATGAALGAAACGPLCALLGGLIGLIAGAIVGGTAGAAVGAGAGAIAGAVVNSRHEEAREKFDYFYNEHLLNALVLGEIDTEISVARDRRRVMDISTFITSNRRPSEGGPPPSQVSNSSRLDFLGINYYRTVFIYHDAFFAGSVPYAGGIFKDDLRQTEETPVLVNDLGWGMHADGLEQIVTRVHRTYSRPERPLPIIISENGCPESADKLRAPYTVAHLEALERAMQEPDPPTVLGYIHWTLADNYEWHHGYNDNSRFGLFTVDRQPPNERRITEGALAFHTLARSRDTNIARAKYGSLERNAPAIVEPTESPGALWIGQVGGTPVRLWLTRLGPDSVQGMLCYPNRNRWVRVDAVEYDSETRQITFSHGAFSGTPGRTFTATVRDRALQDGVWVDSWPAPRTRGTWSAQRDLYVGLWVPTADDLTASLDWDPSQAESWKLLSLERWDLNQWRAKILWRRCTWESIQVRDETIGGTTFLDWSGSNGTFVATLVGTPTRMLLQGRIRPTRYWPAAFLFEASRLPDGVF